CPTCSGQIGRSVCRLPSHHIREIRGEAAAMKDTLSENRIISIRTSRVEKFAELSVSDRGPGVGEDKLKEVFEPFFTSKAEGMGMGLSIAPTIIWAHDGLIWAINWDHDGASFRIRLPLSE